MVCWIVIWCVDAPSDLDELAWKAVEAMFEAC